VRQLTLPEWGISTPVSGKVAKKGLSEKLKIKAFIFSNDGTIIFSIFSIVIFIIIVI
jgi:hypothetical protein